MTKYEELEKLAQAWKDGVFKLREDAADAMARLVEGLSSYLSCPARCLSYVAVTSTLEFGPVDTNPALMTRPKPIAGRDLFWYVGINFLFGSPGSYGSTMALYGLRRRSDGCFDLRSSGKDVVICPDDSTSVSQFCERTFEEIERFFRSTAVDAPRIGFRPGEHS